MAACLTSVLFLYRRLFERSQFRLVSLLLIIVSGLWWAAGTLVEIFNISPIPSYWNPNIPGRFLINYDDFWLSAMVTELVIEVIILGLPFSQIVTLQLCRRRKILLSVIFLLGGLVVITGIIRIVYVYKPSNSSQSLFFHVMIKLD